MTEPSWLVDDRAHALLARLEPVLTRRASAPSSLLDEIAKSLIARGGKRIRPALVFVAASFGQGEDEALLEAAAAVELVHVASLYHDDVMDRAPTRRGDVSVNGVWGNAPAVLAGTFLFARATAMVAALGDEVNVLASRFWADLCGGQLHEVENAYDLDLPEAEHVATIERKTATLFELPCRLGAALADLDDESTAALAAYGRSIGVAFQLIDDTLDFVGNPSELGKQPEVDLRNGVYSLPVLLAARSDGPQGRQIRKLLELARPTEADLHEVHEMVRRSRAVVDVRARAEAAVKRAVAAVRPLPRGAASDSLERLAQHVVTRSA
jgi:heptaprenyl diphosphate synthase